MTMTEKTVYKGKYGYYPCSYETYLKLKALYKAYWEAVYRHSHWYRWNMKDPKNQVRKWELVDGKKVRLAKHSFCREQNKILCLYKPWPEPELGLFIKKTEHKKLIGMCHREYIWYSAEVDPDLKKVVVDFNRARTPVVESQVVHLTLSLEKIDELYRQLQ